MASLTYIAAALPAILIALALHEYGHAAMATKMGDPTPRLQGRLTLNPVAHLDPAGTFMIIITLIMGFGFGWGKPVQTNPTYYHDYAKGRVLVAIAGPAMNLAQAMLALAVGFILYSSGVQLPEFLHMLLSVYIIINLVLMVFNLLPIPPLDGGHVLEMLVPWRQREKFRQFASYGILILLGLMFFGILHIIIGLFMQGFVLAVSGIFGSDYAYYLLSPMFSA